MLDRWMVLVHGEYAEDLYRAPEDVLSSLEAIREVRIR